MSEERLRAHKEAGSANKTSKENLSFIAKWAGKHRVLIENLIRYSKGEAASYFCLWQWTWCKCKQKMEHLLCSLIFKCNWLTWFDSKSNRFNFPMWLLLK